MKPNDFDVCECGDWRHQHANGTGRCNLGSLCTPRPCQKFRLADCFEDRAEAEKAYALARRTSPNRDGDQVGRTAWGMMTNLRRIESNAKACQEKWQDYCRARRLLRRLGKDVCDRALAMTKNDIAGMEGERIVLLNRIARQDAAIHAIIAAQDRRAARKAAWEARRQSATAC